MTTKSKAVGAALLLCLGLAALSCGARQPMRGTEASDLDRKLSYFAFIEEGDILSFIVGTKATRYREDAAYIPFEICIANRGLRKLSLTRESFTLIDEEGNRYPAASPRELMDSYPYLDFDRESMAELQSIIFNKFAAFQQYPSKFSPTHVGSQSRSLSGGSNLVQDLVSLPKFGYLLDFIYFPQPTTGLKGHKFELFMESPDLEDPVFVKLIVK